MAALVEESVLVKLAQKLAGNEKKHRDIAVKKLRKWIRNRSQTTSGFSRKDFLKLWKGLHYCMWMSDKLLIQEELSDNIASLVLDLQTSKQVLLFVDVFFETESREWFGIDRLRLDKFMMLIRVVFRKLLLYLSTHKYKRSLVRHVTRVMAKSVLAPGDGVCSGEGIRFHVADLYLEEIDRSCQGKMSADRVMLFLEPFCQAMANTKLSTLRQHITKRVFRQFVDWEEEKAEALAAKEAQEDDSDDDDDDEIEIPQHIQVDYKVLADRLFELGSDAKCPSHNRKSLYGLVKVFQDLSSGVLPTQPEDDGHYDDLTEADIDRAVDRMTRFEDKLMAKDKRKRKQKDETPDLSVDEQPKKKKKKKTENGLSQEVAKNAGKKENSGKKEKCSEKIDNEKNQEILMNGQTSLKKKAKLLGLENLEKESKKALKNKKAKKNVKQVDDSENVEPEKETETTEEKPQKDTEKNSENSAEKQDDSSSSVKAGHPPTKPKSKVKKAKAATQDLEESLQKDESLVFTGGFCSDSDDEADVSINTKKATPQKNSASKKTKKSTKSDEPPLITMTKLPKTPPAFVKRALQKMNHTANSEPRRASAKLTTLDKAPGSAPGSGKKKVIFQMKKNQAQDFSDSLMVSPQLPFNPQRRPEQGILKPSPLATAASPLATAGKKGKHSSPLGGKSPRQKLFKKKRMTAADFM